MSACVYVRLEVRWCDFRKMKGQSSHPSNS